MKKIGIMGGTFDPIHNGHLLLGQQALTEYQIDQVWYMPSGQPPHKEGRNVSRVSDRCAMIQEAIIPYPKFIFSDFEVIREGKTYTSKTLEQLNQIYPQYQFFFIVGADSLYEIETWHNPAKVLSLATFLVAGRNYQLDHPELDQQISYLRKKYHADIARLHWNEINISSEMIRNLCRKKQAIHDYVPKAVAEYITRNNLYQQESGNE